MAEGTVEPVPIKVFRVNDPVHGSIEIEGKEICLIIDTPEFQRLRKIKQLGGVCYVYPGANHTRFEHSIGVCYIASELLKHLQEYDSNYAYYKSHSRPENEEIRYDLCVKVAALCHDLGHGPYSHLYDIVHEKNEKLVNKDIKKLCQHEYRSVKILEKIHERLKQKQGYTINETEIEEIGKMITFSEDYKANMKKAIDSIPNKDKAYFYEIVANGFTGIDVDKMDYFIRDGHGMGLSSSFEWRRYIQTLKILPVDDPSAIGDKLSRLCSREKEAPELYQLFHIRNQLYRQGYQHKTSECVQKMMGEALKNARDLYISVSGEYAKYSTRPWAGISILQAWQDIDAFLHLTDTIEDTIMQQPTLEKAREIFHRIKERKLWKFIGQVGIEKKDEAEEGIKSILKDSRETRKFEDLIAVQPVKFSYGMKKTDPIEHHWFYGKTRPGEQLPNPYHLKQNQVSRMLPTTFLETKVFFYYKLPQEDAEKIELLRTALDNVNVSRTRSWSC